MGRADVAYHGRLIIGCHALRVELTTSVPLPTATPAALPALPSCEMSIDLATLAMACSETETRQVPCPAPIFEGRASRYCMRHARAPDLSKHRQYKQPVVGSLLIGQACHTALAGSVCSAACTIEGTVIENIFFVHEFPPKCRLLTVDSRRWLSNLPWAL